ncbi:MAG: hypothetical protein LAO77_11945 [Acidobacteriia bacterium]|nr:hypothetical protein [Terriglobia bacterium]
MSDHALTRRDFVARAVAAIGGLAAVPPILERLGLLDQALKATPDLTHDTINGLGAFLIPGPDAYSVAQGVTAPDPGAIGFGATDAYIHALNYDFLFLPTLADSVAALLNDVALTVNPSSATGVFQSAFANLSFADKAKVFETLDGDSQYDDLRNLISIVPGLLVFVAFSEAPVWDRATRTLTGMPGAWTLAGYPGPAEGRDEFIGYYENRRKADA